MNSTIKVDSQPQATSADSQQADSESVCPPTGGSGPISQPINTRRARVVKSVLLRIFAGEIVGGDRLVEEELAERLGVSRTPIREALTELAGIGVIWIKPNHGAMVRPFGSKQLTEIYQIRRLLESEATRQCEPFIDRNELREIRERMHELRLASEKQRNEVWSQNALTQDRRLHELIACSSGSERLAEEIHRYWTLAITIGQAVGNAAQTQDCALIEHTAVIDALIEGDAPRASAAMADHLTRREEAALQALAPRLKKTS